MPLAKYNYNDVAKDDIVMKYSMYKREVRTGFW
jgi:hypothetical protein